MFCSMALFFSSKCVVISLFKSYESTSDGHILFYIEEYTNEKKKKEKEGM